MKPFTLVSFLFILLLFFSMLGCGNGADDDNDDSGPSDDDGFLDDDSDDDNASDDDSAVDDDTLADDDTTDDDTTPSSNGFTIDFEDYDLGELPGPDWWKALQNGSSYAEVVILNEKASGKGMHLFGGLEIIDELYMGYRFDEYASNSTFQFEVKPEGDSYFAVGLYQLNNNYLNSEFYVDIHMDTGQLEAIYGAPQSSFDCPGFVPSNWNTINLSINFIDAKYTVYINGIENDICHDLDFFIGDGHPLAAFMVVDASGSGVGGDVFFDNFELVINP